MAMSWRGQTGVLFRRQKDLYFVTLPSSYEPRGQAGIKIEAEMKVEVSTATGIVEIQDINNCTLPSFPHCICIGNSPVTI